MSWLITVLVSSIILLFFIGLAGTGLLQPRRPKAAEFVISGFIGLAFVPILLGGGIDLVASHLRETGAIDFDHYERFYFLAMILANELPILALLVLGIMGLIFRKHPGSSSFIKIGFIGALVAFVFIGATAPSRIKGTVRPAEIRTIDHASIIRDALEKYATEMGGQYPGKIELLIGTLAQFPTNPFTNQPMKDIPYGSSDYYGNFTYLPVSVGDKVLGYYLIAYGHKRTKGKFLLNPTVDDHVIFVERNSGNPEWPQEVPFPDVKQVIESAQK